MEINRRNVELARMILDAACNGQSATDLDDQAAATIRSLSLLTAGGPVQFCQWQQPPLEVLTWLRKTDLSGVHGILAESLQRWHELRR